MKTPILDFITEYETKQSLRLHMPGHKGQGAPADITEIAGADSLYEAAGIIAESEQNASRLFSHPTFYSTEGSSQCIRAMLYLAHLDAHENILHLAVIPGDIVSVVGSNQRKASILCQTEDVTVDSLLFRDPVILKL